MLRVGLVRLGLGLLLSMALDSCSGRGWPTGFDWGGGSTAAANRAPVAHAGLDQEAAVADTVQLTGMGSWDADGDPLTYRWTSLDGADLDVVTLATPRFVASVPRLYRFVLVVNDGTVDSAPDEVQVTARPADDPTGSRRTLTADLPGSATMEFVWIEAGTFTMGSPSSEVGRRDNEGPLHQVTLTRGFWLGQCEVTQGQWYAAMGTRPWLGQAYAQANPAHPAVWVRWEDAQALVQRLNEWAGGALYRLPTEAEWEYSCRAGTAATWSFGSDVARLPDCAWYGDNGSQAGLAWAQPVGTRRANPWGLYDMHGNVWEWVVDGYSAYSDAPQTDPQGPLSGARRLVRGGGFDTSAEGTRAAFRYDLGVGNQRNGSIGIRLVRVR